MIDVPPASSILERCQSAAWLDVFDHLPDHILFVKSEAGQILALNRQAGACCGVEDKAEALGKTMYDFFPRPWCDQSSRDDAEVLRTGAPLLHRLEAAPHRAGSSQITSTTKMPLRDQQGAVIGVISLARLLQDQGAAPVHSARLTKVIQKMQEDLSAELKTRELAKLAGLSISQLDRCFQAAFGTSPHHYHLRLRIEEACRLLARTDQKISAVAQACGFYDHAHFGRLFRQAMLMSPLQYRQTQQISRVPAPPSRPRRPLPGLS